MEEWKSLSIGVKLIFNLTPPAPFPTREGGENSPLRVGEGPGERSKGRT